MPTSRSAVTLRDARVHYDAHRALDGIDLDITDGAHTIITGANGSGKSTLLSVIAGIIALDAGSLVKAHRAVAFVPQRSSVSDRLPITVRETVMMGRWTELGMLRRPRAEDHDVVEHYLDRLDLRAIARRRLGDLSGGQRQRALLGQALAQRAPLLLLDEPSTGLDADAQATMTRVLEHEVSEGLTVITATHDDALVAVGDHHIVLREGRVFTP